ncbi:MAG: flagellar protein FlgN [Candidatus Kapaibacterium sp.]
MLDKLMNFLKHEEHLLSELVELAAKQQIALVKFDMRMLEEVSKFQEAVANSLRESEDKRIRFLMSKLGCGRAAAADIRLSQLEKYFEGDELMEVKILRKKLKNLLDRLQDLNTSNRVLANRARSGVAEALSLFTNGRQNVCNVRI